MTIYPFVKQIQETILDSHLARFASFVQVLGQIRLWAWVIPKLASRFMDSPDKHLCRQKWASPDTDQSFSSIEFFPAAFSAGSIVHWPRDPLKRAIRDSMQMIYEVCSGSLGHSSESGMTICGQNDQNSE